MPFQVDNAIIMAAGTSSRFAPLSQEYPKALIPVRGEILIERQIIQLKEVGIKDIIVVVGYKKLLFEYLTKKYNVTLIENPEFSYRNNNSSIYWVKNHLNNSYICSADNYFSLNPFESTVSDSYYSALFSPNQTNEWCLETDSAGYINKVTIGGNNSWYMLGHVFWSQEFSRKFLDILLEIYDDELTKPLLWEHIYIKHLDLLKMQIRKYRNEDIYEFDSLEELRLFDPTYINNSGSSIMQNISTSLKCSESEITNINIIKSRDEFVIGFSFSCPLGTKQYIYDTNEII